MSLIDELKNNSEIHVYIIRRDENLSYNKILKIISDQEKVIMQDFKFEKDRQLYAQTRYSIRNILSRYLMIHPQKIEFSQNNFGKPKIIDYINKDLLEFNISHSKDIIVFVISYKLPVGIDVEFMNKNIEIELFNNRIFNDGEIKALSDLVQCLKLKHFYKLWTCKEAHLKRLGVGIINNMREIIVSEDFSTIYKSDQARNKSFLTELDYLPENYVGAIALSSQYKEIYKTA